MDFLFSPFGLLHLFRVDLVSLLSADNTADYRRLDYLRLSFSMDSYSFGRFLYA